MAFKMEVKVLLDYLIMVSKNFTQNYLRVVGCRGWWKSNWWLGLEVVQTGRGGV